jgi:hypothetical protein
MHTITTLPNELIDHIILQLHATIDRSTLQVCALMSKSWLNRLRPILFDIIHIAPRTTYYISTRARTKCMVLSYARHISLNHAAGQPNAEAILHTLCVIAPYLSDKFCSLHISLTDTQPIQWSELGVKKTTSERTVSQRRISRDVALYLVSKQRRVSGPPFTIRLSQRKLVAMQKRL